MIRALAVLLIAGSAAGAAGAQTIAIVGGTVYPVSGPKIDHGTVVIRDGKIVAVGANVAVPSGAQRIDATGKWVTPGLINSATLLGVEEVQAVPDTRDATAKGANAVSAAFRVADGFNPHSVLIQPTRNDGVTSVVATPDGGNVIAGQAIMVDLADGPVAEMMIRAPAAMFGQIGDAQSAGFTARGEVTGRLRELFDDVRSYAKNPEAYDRAQSRPLSASRADLEALRPVLDGKLPLVIVADRASDITQAIAIAKEYKLNIMIAGGAEAWEVAGALAAAKVPVLTGAMNNVPESFERLGQRQDNAMLLRRAGVSVMLIGNAAEEDTSPFNIRNIRQEAGEAVAYGLAWDEALRAITLAPAEAFGVADRVGSLQAGRSANVVVWSGDPFEFSTRAEVVLIHGKPVTAPSRQDQLMQRYKSLPRPTYQAP